MGVVDTRLHLGSGEHYTPGWFNVDVDPIWPTDLLCDANDLPGYCAAGTFTHLYLGHYLEHIPYGQIPAMMERVLTVCTPDVKIAVVGPCYELAKVHARSCCITSLIGVRRRRGRIGGPLPPQLPAVSLFNAACIRGRSRSRRSVNQSGRTRRTLSGSARSSALDDLYLRLEAALTAAP